MMIESAHSRKAVNGRSGLVFFFTVFFLSAAVFASKRVADFGINSLMYAASENDYALLDSLVCEGMDLNAKSDQGWTVLWFAKTPEMLRYLVGKGADINARSKTGRTVLARIAMEDPAPNPKLRELVALGAEVDSRGQNEITPLMGAVRNSQDIEVLFFLVFLGADINATDVMGRTALMYAASANPARAIMAERRSNLKTEDVLRALIMLGADVNLKDNEGKSALLLFAAKDDNHRRLESMRLLVNQGADVHCLTDRNESALVLLSRSFLRLAKYGNRKYIDRRGALNEEIEFFLKCGVDPELKDKDGKTYLDYLREVVRFDPSFGAGDSP